VQLVSGVVVEHQRGSAGYLHGLDPFADGPVERPQVWICSVEAPAIVLGSRQRPDVLDLDACERAGLEVVRRRSGGGAVLLRPDAVAWIDLVLPPGSVADDIRASMVWAGERWRDALLAVSADGDADADGTAGRLAVHRGAMTGSPWSDLVCFAGIGPGEVLVGGRKLVGLSQRRTRHGVRIQGQLHRRSLVGELPSLFAVDVPAEPVPEPAVLADIEPTSRDISDELLAAGIVTSMVASMVASMGARTTPV
jgi:lipoate-protein ligase A